jgi:hypothetical protein
MQFACGNSLQGVPQVVTYAYHPRALFSRRWSCLYRGRRRTEYQIVVSRYGIPIYEQPEYDFEKAIWAAKAFIEWQPEQHTDS